MKSKSILALVVVFLMTFMAFSFLVPGQPTLNSPKDGATGVSRTPTLYWNALSPTPTNYHIQVMDQYNNVVREDQNISGLSTSFYITQSLDGNTTYYWHIRASDDEWGPWSDTWHFTTQN